MIINQKVLCDGCFSELDAEGAKCAICGYHTGAGGKYPSALPLGTILMGRYIIGNVLGKGGFGITYLAYDNTDQKKVAVKEYLPENLIHRNTGETLVSTTDEEREVAFKKGAERFYEEAQTVSRFNGNPGLVWVYKFFYENQTAYFVMEYLEGANLKEYVARNGNALSEEKVVKIMESLIDSLIIVHSIGVLHRDISPDNVFITKDETVKLIDFGAARQVLGEASKSLSVVLKQGFAPIEQYQTRGKQGQWTDIYALGATLYYCLTGQIPDAPMDRLEEDRFTPPDNISAELSSVLDKMLAIRAVNRYQDMMELKKDMQTRNILPNVTLQPLSLDDAVDDSKTKVNPLINYFSGKKNLAVVSAVIGAVVVISCVAILISNGAFKSVNTGNMQGGGGNMNQSAVDGAEAETTDLNAATSPESSTGQETTTTSQTTETTQRETTASQQTTATTNETTTTTPKPTTTAPQTTAATPKPTTTAPQTTTAAPKPTTTAPQTTTTTPKPTTTTPKPTTTAPQTTTATPKPTTTAPQTTATTPKPTTTAPQTTTANINWVYYGDDTGLYKKNPNGSEVVKINSDMVYDNQIIVSGDWIYYSTPNSNWIYQLYKIKTDGKNKTLLCKDDCLDIVMSGNWIFYINGMDAGLYKVKTDGTGRASMGIDARSGFSISGDWIYYTDNGVEYKIKTDGTGKQSLAPLVTTVGDQRYTYTDPYMSGASGLYSGEWANGMPNGKGMFIFDKTYSDMGYPSKYVGEWKDGNKHGQGTATWSDGSYYVGNFVNNKKSGKGIMYNAEGSVIWDGNWVDDMPDS